MQTDAALAERAHDDVGGFDVDAGKDARQRFHHRDLAAEVAQQGRELTTDRSRADDQHPRRDLGEREHVIGREDSFTVEVEPGERARQRTRREHERAALELRTVGHPDVTGGGVDHGSGAGHDGDLAPLEQALETLGQSVDDLLLAGLAGSQVERRLARVDAELLGAGDRAQHLGRLEQLLRRDAAAVKARATDSLLLDQGDSLAHRGAVQGGRVPGRPTAEDHDVELLSHFTSFPRCGAGYLRLGRLLVGACVTMRRA